MHHYLYFLLRKSRNAPLYRSITTSKPTQENLLYSLILHPPPHTTLSLNPFFSFLIGKKGHFLGSSISIY